VNNSGVQMSANAGQLGSDWRPLPNPISAPISFAGVFPAHTDSYISQHGGDFFVGGVNVAQILGEDNLGSATVSWSFTPMMASAAGR
jgi:hypothetical protein